MTKQVMQEPTFLILTALADGSAARLRDHDRRRRDLGRAGLSSGPERCTRRWTGCSATGSSASTARRSSTAGWRRYYRLTPAGAELLAAEAARLSANASVAAARLRKLRGGGAPAGGAAMAGGTA